MRPQVAGVLHERCREFRGPFARVGRFELVEQPLDRKSRKGPGVLQQSRVLERANPAVAV